MSLTSPVPLPYRLLALGLLSAALLAFGWVKGATHVQRDWDASKADQAIQNAKIQTQRKDKTTEIHRETNRLIDRSDAWYRGLRTRPDDLRIPGSTGQADAAPPTASPGTAGDPAGAECSPSDGAADAIVILEWQRWIGKMKGAGP